jgi:alpha-mannosidase
MLARGDAFLDGLAVRRDDLQHHAPGCYSAHSGIKAWQRRAQWAVLSAERWAAVDSALSGADYPRADLERAWKQILFNQFHDILPGSAIEPSYDDARDQLGEAVAIAKRIITRAHNRIARRIDIPPDAATQPVVVFNPHPWPVSVEVDMQYGVQPLGVRVVDHEGREVLAQPTQSTATTGDRGRGAVTFRADVPALGYALYRLAPGPATASGTSLSVSDDGTVIENAHLRLELDPLTGDLVSLLDKDSGLDPLAGTRGAPRTAICDDPTDTWGHRVISYAWPGAAMTLDRIVVRETGPLRSRVRVERSWRDSRLVEEYLLAHDSRAVRVDVTLDWREQAHLMKLRFPVGLSEPSATYEIPYGTIERPVDGAEEPAQSWVDLTGTLDGRAAGLTVVCTAKHGWDVSPAGAAASDVPSIGITAVRSPVYSWHDPRLLDPEGVYSFQDQGVQRFALELIPHAGDWRVAQPTRRAAVLGAPVRAQQESFHAGDLPPVRSFADDGAGAVMVTAIKGSEDVPDGAPADLVVRAVETTGRKAEARIELPLAGRVIAGDFRPHQVRTFRVPRDPDAEIVEVDLLEWPLRAPSPDGDSR